MNAESAMADLAGAVDRLWARARPRERVIGVLGFSLGACYALRLSAEHLERVRAVALFYGTGGADFSRARAAYIGHFAGADPYEPAEGVDWLETALKSAGLPQEYIVVKAGVCSGCESSKWSTRSPRS